jgi:hypothetical protein
MLPITSRKIGLDLLYGVTGHGFRAHGSKIVPHNNLTLRLGSSLGTSFLEEFPICGRFH